MEIFEAWPVALFIVAGLLGLVVGSFLNVVAYRIPIMMERAWRAQCDELKSQPFTPPPHVADGARFDLWWPPSTCPGCGKAIAPQHNVPVLGFLWLHGRCAGCGVEDLAALSVVEAFAAVLAVAVAYVFGPTWADGRGARLHVDLARADADRPRPQAAARLVDAAAAVGRAARQRPFTARACSRR